MVKKKIVYTLIAMASIGFALSEVLCLYIVAPIFHSNIKDPLVILSKINVFSPIFSLLVAMIFWNFGFSLITVFKKDK